MAHIIKAGAWIEKRKPLKGELDLDQWLNSQAVSATWGSIGGTLSNQTDLQTALNTKDSVTTASNGITRTLNNFTLGGTLTAATTIAAGNNSLDFTIANNNLSFTHSGTSGDIVLGTTANGGIYLSTLSTASNGISIEDRSSNGIYIDSKINAGGIYIRGLNSAPIAMFSRGGGMVFTGATSTGVVKTVLTLSESAMTLQDVRTGALAVGMEYVADYSANYSNRSLVDKAYVTAAVSDVRLKENITELPNTLEKVNLLRPVEFDFIATKQHETGFIAQEVEGIFPHLILEDEGILKIKRNEWIPILVKAVQELTAKVADLEAKLKQNG